MGQQFQDDAENVAYPPDEQQQQQREENKKKAWNDFNMAFIHTGIAGLSFLSAQLLFRAADETQKKINKLEQEHVYKPMELLQKLNSNNTLFNKRNNLRIVQYGNYFVEGVIGYPSSVILNVDNSKQLVAGETKHLDIQMKMNEKRELIKQTVERDTQKFNIDHFYISEINPTQDTLSNHVMIEKIEKTNKKHAFKSVGTKDQINGDNFRTVSSLAVGAVLSIGIQQEQIGIEVGDRILSYGKVLLDTEKMQLIFRQPEYLMKSKEDFIASLTGSNLAVQLLGFLLIGLSLYETYNIFWRMYQGLKKKMILR